MTLYFIGIWTPETKSIKEIRITGILLQTISLKIANRLESAIKNFLEIHGYDGRRTELHDAYYSCYWETLVATEKELASLYNSLETFNWRISLL